MLISLVLMTEHANMAVAQKKIKERKSRVHVPKNLLLVGSLVDLNHFVRIAFFHETMHIQMTLVDLDKRWPTPWS